MIPVDIDKLSDALGEAVALKGEDYVYDSSNGCQYFTDDLSAPSRIIGHAIDFWGVAPEEMRDVVRDDEYEDNDDTSWNTFCPVGDLVGPDEFIMVDSDTTGKVMQRVQELQDVGVPWGQAVALAAWMAADEREWWHLPKVYDENLGLPTYRWMGWSLDKPSEVEWK